MEKLRIIFIGYWSITDGLTKATILPWLKIMQESHFVQKVILCTIERDATKPTTANPVAEFTKVDHVALYPTNRKYPLLTKISDFVQFPREIISIAKKQKATTVFAHGAPAGALAYKVWKSLKLPFYVSSFEPHAAYMAESGVWHRRGLKYTFQRYWENKQRNYAVALMPVTQSFTEKLIKEGVPAQNLRTVPCYVNAVAFKFDKKQRERIRTGLNWQNNTIGIYAGKYGGLYYQQEAFRMYAQCFHLIPSFRLIILTPQPEEEVYAMLAAQSIDREFVVVKQVPHGEVPAYLSAADFAFSTYKPGPSKKYLSPVKVGEYWANGLPVLLTEGVGDDSDIINNEGGGALFNLEQEGSVEQAIRQILSILKDPQHRQEIPKLAHKYRSPDRLREAFEYFFRKGEQESSI